MKKTSLHESQLKDFELTRTCMSEKLDCNELVKIAWKVVEKRRLHIYYRTQAKISE